MSKTTYEVGVKYTMDDKASAGMANMAQTAKRAESSMLNLRTAMVGLGFAAGAAALGKKVLIDYNSEIDSMRIGLAAVLQMQMHMPLARAREEANGLFDALQQIAKSSPGTTKDFIEMATTIAPAVAAAGGSVRKIQDLAQGAVIAGKAMGIRADVAALDIKQMLAGTVSARDMLAQQMILAHGLDSQRFNALSARERGQFVEKALTDPALKAAAKTYGESFEGQMSTAMDNFQIGMGKLGRPLMGEVAKALGEANRWIEENPRKIQEFTKKFGDGIRDAFTSIKGIFSWIVDNKETLLSIGKLFVTFKGAQLVTNEIGLVAQGIKGFGEALAQPRDGLNLFGMSLSSAATAISLLIVGANEFADWVDRRQSAGIDAAAKWETAGLSMTDANRAMFGLEDPLKIARRNMSRAQDEGFINSAGQINEGLIRGTGKEAGAVTNEVDNYLKVLRDTVETMKRFDLTMQDMSGTADDASAAYWRQTMGQFDQGVFAGDPSFKKSDGDWAGAPGPAKVNVTIQRIEVASEDPDRFVIGAVKAFENVAKNPTQAEATITGGF